MTPEQVLGMLSDAPQPAVPWYARWLAFLTTPFKFLGIQGWTNTGDFGTAKGKLVRAAQHSTDGFYTIDIALESISVMQNSNINPLDTLNIPAANKYIRLEIEPGTMAHMFVKHHIKELVQGASVAVGGGIYVDADGPFLEIHPTGLFNLV